MATKTLSPEFRAFETVLSSSSNTNQNPSGTDSPLQVEFGTPTAVNTDFVTLDPSGEVSVVMDGVYDFNIILSSGRLGAGGVSMLYGRYLLNGVQAGGSVLAELDNSNVIIPMQFEVIIPMNAGDKLTIEIYRDSAGNNSGGLLSATPTLAWNDSPSAAIAVNFVHSI